MPSLGVEARGSSEAPTFARVPWPAAKTLLAPPHLWASGPCVQLSDSGSWSSFFLFHGKLRLASGLRRPPRWSRLQYYAVAAYAYVEDLQDELQGEWNDWTPDKFTGDNSEDEFDSCSEWDDGEAVGYRGVPDRGPPREQRRTVTETGTSPRVVGLDLTRQDKTPDQSRPKKAGRTEPNRAKPN